MSYSHRVVLLFRSRFRLPIYCRLARHPDASFSRLDLVVTSRRNLSVRRRHVIGATLARAMILSLRSTRAVLRSVVEGASSLRRLMGLGLLIVRRSLDVDVGDAATLAVLWQGLVLVRRLG